MNILNTSSPALLVRSYLYAKRNYHLVGDVSIPPLSSIGRLEAALNDAAVQIYEHRSFDLDQNCLLHLNSPSAFKVPPVGGIIYSKFHVAVAI